MRKIKCKVLLHSVRNMRDITVTFKEEEKKSLTYSFTFFVLSREQMTHLFRQEERERKKDAVKI